MKLLKLIFVFTFLILTKDIHSKTLMDSSSSAIIIEGVILDSSLVNNPDFESSLTLTISEYPFTSGEMNGVPCKKFEIKYKAGDRFKVKIPDAPAICYMYISYSRPKAFISTFNWVDNIYILQRGDSIFCKLKSNSHEFSGIGAKKLQCQSEVYKLKFVPKGALFKLLQNNETYLQGLSILSKKQDSVQWLQLGIIQKYKKEIGKDLTNALMANCIGLRYFGFLRGINGNKRNTARFQQFIGSEMYKRINSIDLKNISSSLLASSPVYSSFLFQRSKINASINDQLKVDTISGKLFSRRIFKSIQMNFTGILREKMLTLYVVNFSLSPSFDFELIDEALNQMQNPIYRKALSNISKTKSAGKKFYNFQLEDENGKLVKLSDFNNNVVILDFWYTGCIACLRLHQAMQPIFQKLKDQAKVSFVTISIDKDKTEWKRSIASGKYTAVNSINLYTNGIGDKHPIIKENLIYAYPTMYILKDGEVLSSSPPKPGSQGKIDEFLQLIYDAVASL